LGENTTPISRQLEEVRASRGQTPAQRYRERGRAVSRLPVG